MSLQNTDNSMVLSGTVRTFNKERGYGFYVPSTGKRTDVLVSTRVLVIAGFPSEVSAGSEITCEVELTDKGLRAVKVLSLVPFKPEPIKFGQAPDEPAATSVKARVKWFNNLKGYGFLIAANLPDIYVHKIVLKRSGLHSLSENQEVLAQYRESTKGLEAVNIFAVKPDAGNAK